MCCQVTVTRALPKETGVLKGEYGATPRAVDAELQAKVLEGERRLRVGPLT